VFAAHHIINFSTFGAKDRIMAVPGYLLVLGHSLVPEKMAKYSAALPPIYEKFCGCYLGIGGPGRGVEHLEGPWSDHSVVLGRFNEPDDVSKFWCSPEYEQAKKLRMGGGEFNVFKIPGNEYESQDGEPAFLISIYRILDPDVFAPLAKTEEERLKNISVPYILKAKNEETERLEGDLIGHDFSVASFPTQSAATSFWNDPRNKELREARSEAAIYNSFLVRGVRR
jgi:uncharacterized protein (DUF1330 family)